MGSEVGSIMVSEVGGRVSEGGGIGSEVDGRFFEDAEGGARGVGIGLEVSETDVGCSDSSVA